LADDLQAQRVVVHYLAHSTIGPFSLVNVIARWVELLSSQTTEPSFKRPERLGRGRYMTVAVLDGSYRKVGSDGLLDLSDGLLDLSGTVAVLRFATELVGTIPVPAG
jgi:hypothetical protein